MIILGIETSCDDTSVALVEAKKNSLTVLANIISSQIAVHAPWGGVVPSLAAREHLKNILPVMKKALRQARVSRNDIDLIAVTQGPGLIPALLIGNNFAKTLAYAWKKPLIGMHHIEGHIYANFIQAMEQSSNIFPLLALVVSGGHTQLILMKKHLHYEILGETIDDAAGEAFDKSARLLNLGYPGGPEISRVAAACKQGPGPKSICLPRPMIKNKDLNFSFSGLKTAVLYETKKNKHLIRKKEYVSAVAHEFQQAVVDVLVAKTIRAAQENKIKAIVLAGGVSANQELRRQLSQTIQDKIPQTLFLAPKLEHCLDNAGMIATGAYYRWKSMNKNERKDLNNGWRDVMPDANLKLKA